MTTEWDAKDHRHPPSPILGTRRLRSRGPRARILPEAPGEGPSHLFQLLGLQVALGWWPPPSRLCLHLHVASAVCLGLRFCLLGGHCPWREGPPHPGGPPLRPLTSSHLQRPCLQVRSHSWVQPLRRWDFSLLLGDTTQITTIHITHVCTLYLHTHTHTHAHTHTQYMYRINKYIYIYFILFLL